MHEDPDMNANLKHFTAGQREFFFVWMHSTHVFVSVHIYFLANKILVKFITLNMLLRFIDKRANNKTGEGKEVVPTSKLNWYRITQRNI